MKIVDNRVAIILVTLIFFLSFVDCNVYADSAEQKESNTTSKQIDTTSSATPGRWADEEDEEAYKAVIEDISDPLQGYNRAVYRLNDAIYRYGIKPLAQGYRKVVPEPGRKSVRKFFNNVAFPTRLINCLLQGKMAGAGIELSRFAINTTVGIGGFFDPAKSYLRLPAFDEDFDQTLGVWGAGTGMYLVLPFFGPSSVRGTIGKIGDFALDPFFYIKIKTIERVGIKLTKQVNTTTFFIDEYDKLQEAALDPYIAMRNAYFQNRHRKVRR
jgi:phospholipid-binding lipoprotein MlaA